MREPYLAIYLVGMVILLVVMMFYQHLRRTHDLLSVRNLYLAGFIVYLLVSVILVFLTGETGPFMITDIGAAGLVYCFYLTVYLILFLWAYTWQRPALPLARRVPVPSLVTSDGLMLFVGLLLALLALPLRFAAQVPLIGPLTVYISLGFAAVSASLMGWVVARRFMNPILWLFAGFIVSIDLVTSIINQMSRRPMLAVLLAILWGAYYARIRFLPPLRGLVVFACLVIPPFLLLSLYTTVRTQEFRELGAGQIVQELMSPSEMTLGEGMLETLAGQNTGAAALWTIEAYPGPFPRRHLLSLRYIFIANIPRAIWPGKPIVYSAYIAYQANIQGANRNRAIHLDEGVTLPPGVIAYAEAEGGFYAVIVYAVFFAISLRFLQNLCWLHADNPFVVSSVGASLGTVTALSRGDIALFSNQIFLSTASAYIFIYIITKLLFVPSGASYEK